MFTLQKIRARLVVLQQACALWPGQQHIYVDADLLCVRPLPSFPHVNDAARAMHRMAPHPFCLVLAPNVAEGLPYYMSRDACLKNTANGGWTMYGAIAPSAAEALGRCYSRVENYEPIEKSFLGFSPFLVPYLLPSPSRRRPTNEAPTLTAWGAGLL